MAPRIDLGTLVATVDANTRGYERAMLKLETLTQAVTKSIERDSDPASKAVQKLNKDFNNTTKAIVGLKGALAVLKLFSMSSAIAPAVSGVAALGGAAVVATQALAPLSGVLAGMPFLLGAAVQGVATLKLGTMDLMKALQAPTLKAFNQELAKMDPVTAQATKQLWNLKGSFAEIKAAASSGFAPGLVQGILSASKNLGVLKDVLHYTGLQMGDVFKQFGQYLGGADFKKMFSGIGADAAQTLHAAGIAGLEVFQSIMKITYAAKPLTDYLTTLITDFGVWTKKMTDSLISSGKFATFMQHTVQALKDWGKILSNVGGLLFAIFKAANPEAQLLVGFLKGGSDQLSAWAKSTDGLKSLTSFFEGIAKPITALGAGLGKIAMALGPLLSGPAMDTLASALNVLGDGLAKLVSNELFSGLQAIGPLFNDLIPPVEALLEVVGNIATALMVALKPAFDALSGPLTDFITALGPGLIEMVQNATPGLTAIGQGLAMILESTKPLIPLFTQFAGVVGTVLGGALWILANAVIAYIKFQIWWDQEVLKGAKLFIEQFVVPLLAGWDKILGGAAALAKAMGNESLGKALDQTSDTMKSWAVNAVQNIDVINGALDQTQAQLHLLAWGATIPINIVYSYTQGQADTSTLAGIQAASVAKHPGGTSPQQAAAWVAAAAKSAIRKSTPSFSSSYHPSAASQINSGSSAASSAASARTSAINSWASSASGYASSLTGIAAPANPVVTAFNSMTSSVWKYLGTSLQHRLQAQEHSVQSLYAVNQSVIARLNVAEQNLTTLQNNKAQFAQSTTNMGTGYGAIGNAWGDMLANKPTGNLWTWQQNQSQGSTTLGFMQGRLAKMKEFWSNIGQLKSMGLSGHLIGDIIGAGIDTGNEMAKAILKSPSLVKQFNAVDNEIQSYSKTMGNTAAGWMYDAGISAAQGIVNGLKSQERAIEKQMNVIAAAMVASIKKALGIHSPSVEFAKVGMFSAQGLAKGMDAGKALAATSSASMARTVVGAATSTVAGSKQAPAGMFAGLTIQVNVTVSGPVDEAAVAQIKKAAKTGVNAALVKVAQVGGVGK